MGNIENKQMGIFRIDARNRITLSKEVMNRLNVVSGDYISIELFNNCLTLFKAYFGVRRNNCGGEKKDEGECKTD